MKETVKLIESIQNNLKENETTYIEGYSKDELDNIISSYIESVEENCDIFFDVVRFEIVGSRAKGTAKENSDLDVLLEYANDEIREDDAFNMLNDDYDSLYIDDIKVDFNPICKTLSGYTIDSWKKSNYNYNKEGE